MMSTVVFASGRAWVRSAFSLERDRACKFLDPRLERIGNPGEKPPALARDCPRPGGEGVGCGLHSALDVLGATAWDPGDWTPVRWIFNFEPLARSAVDPFAADQHAFFLRRGLVFAYFGDSRHCHLHRSFCGGDPASGATKGYVVLACAVDRQCWIFLQSVSRRSLPAVGLQPH